MKSVSLCESSVHLASFPSQHFQLWHSWVQVYGNKWARAQNSSERKSLCLWNQSVCVETCHSVSVSKPFMQPSICTAEYIWAGGELLDLMACCCCCGGGDMYAVVAFCMSLSSPSVWEAMIHCAWLIPISGFSSRISPGKQTLKLHVTHFNMCWLHTHMHTHWHSWPWWNVHHSAPFQGQITAFDSLDSYSVFKCNVGESQKLKQ